LRKVAAAAGVRLNTVQHRFGDLESLVLATVESMLGGRTEGALVMHIGAVPEHHR
jgi:AcrR family transcriptional regulator